VQQSVQAIMVLYTCCIYIGNNYNNNIARCSTNAAMDSMHACHKLVNGVFVVFLNY